jgi:peptide/nickel transport system permease protein
MAREAHGPSGGPNASSAAPLAENADSTLGKQQARVRQQRSLWNNAWRQFRHHKLAMAGLVIFVGFILITVLGPLFYHRAVNSPFEYDTSTTPSASHLLGTDSMGQDLLARILYGGRISLAVGIVAALVAILIGTLIGALAGFFGGLTDSFLMRFTDLFLALPNLPLLLLITFLFGQSMKDFGDRTFGSPTVGIFLLIVIVIGALAWMQTARLVRASFLSTKEKEFVEAARSIGATQSSLIIKQILPNVMSPIIVAATLEVGSAIITESTLSFLGLGFPSDVPTWGRMLFEAKDYVQMSPHEALIPGGMIFLTVLAINYMGDGLRDALDPRKTN